MNPSPQYIDDLSAEYIRSALDYNPKTGEFRWRFRPDQRPQWNGANAGKIAGTPLHKSPTLSYWIIAINGRKYRAHRLAWLYFHGEWPNGRVDHRDGNGLNNRIGNLRVATQSENIANSRKSRANKSGFKGVTVYKPGNNFRAEITVHGKRKHLGYFDTPEEAHEAYKVAAREAFGQHMREK